MYAIGFVGDLVVLKSIDSGAAAPLPEAVLVDLLLLGLFAVQHSVMARPAFKRWWTRIVPKSVERITYILLASLVLILLFWQWCPMVEPVLAADQSLTIVVLDAVFWLGLALVLFSTFLIDHFELKQVFARISGRPMPAPVFKTPLFYRRVRHPSLQLDPAARSLPSPRNSGLSADHARRRRRAPPASAA